MTPYNEIFSLKAEGLNNSQIAAKAGCSRKTVITVLQLAENKGYTYDAEEKQTDIEIHRILHVPLKREAGYEAIDVEYILCKIQVTGCSATSLWKEYLSECVRQGKTGYSKSMFQNFINESKQSEQLPAFHGRAKICFWTYKTQNENGDINVHTVIVCISDFSQFMVAVEQNDLNPRTWAMAHSAIFEKMSGVPMSIEYTSKVPKRLIVCTNDMASYYGYSFSVRTLKKYNAMMQERFLECRNRFEDEKMAFSAKTFATDNNNLPWRKNAKFKRSDAHNVEVQRFYPLPVEVFDLVETKYPVVQCNFHIEIDENYYSIPFEMRHSKFTVHVSGKYVEICVDDVTVAVHDRVLNGKNHYVTIPEHMPVNDKQIPFGEVSGTSLRKWAATIGPSTSIVIDRLLKRTWCEQQSYLKCRLILMMAYKHTTERLEEACTNALKLKEQITVRVISSYLETDLNV